MPMTIGEANRSRACLDCGAPGALLWRTTKGENPGRLLRICAACLRKDDWHRFGLVERPPIPEEADDAAGGEAMSEPIDIEAIRARAEAASAGPWTRTALTPGRDPLAYFAETYAYGEPGVLHGVAVPFEDKSIDEEAKFVSFTGNGPTSEANAIFITHARADIPALLAEVDRLKGAYEHALITCDEYAVAENKEIERREAAEAERDRLRKLVVEAADEMACVRLAFSPEDGRAKEALRLSRKWRDAASGGRG